jgi:hypothetical protein
MNIILISRTIILWMIIVSSGIIFFSRKNSIPFSIGPNEQLYILQIPINTNTKYMIIITFCFCNSIFRSLHHNFLQPWILHEIQDTDMEKERMVSISICYEISCVSTIYVWFDFFMYMHILLSQIDFFFGRNYSGYSYNGSNYQILFR